MMDENELLFDELYEKTKDFGRTQFVRLLMAKERENKELKIQVSLREEVANKYKEVIDKAIDYLNKYAWQEDIIGGIYTTTGKPAIDRYMQLEWDNCNELLDILKEVE